MISGFFFFILPGIVFIIGVVGLIIKERNGRNH